MLYTIAVTLLVLWARGLVTSTTMGGFIHLLLAGAIVMMLTEKSRGDTVTTLNALLAPLGIDRRKRFMVNGLVVAECLFLSVGCSSLKPEADEHATLESHPCTSTHPPALVVTNRSPSETIQGLVDLVAALLTEPQTPNPHNLMLRHLDLSAGTL